MQWTVEQQLKKLAAQNHLAGWKRHVRWPDWVPGLMLDNCVRNIQHSLNYESSELSVNGPMLK